MSDLFFAQRLRVIIEVTRIKRKELAERVGVDARTVSRWVAGETIPHKSLWPRIFEALGVTEEQFWDAGWLPIKVELVGTNKTQPRRVGPYLNAPTDERYMALRCPRCGSDDFEEDSLYCRQCAFPLYNFCAHPNMKERHINPPKAVYCGQCALPTFWSMKEVTLEAIRGEQWPYRHRNDEEERGTP